MQPQSKPIQIVTSDSANSDVLRRRAPRLHHFEHAHLKRLVDRMHTALRESHGIGIAAPQIGESVAVCSVLLLDDDYDDHPGAWERASALVMVNPEILKRSTSYTSATEACLSVPGFAVKRVTRAEAVIVQYQNMRGVTKRAAAKGLVARIMQHEIDHLNGTLIVDYMQAQEDMSRLTNERMA